MISAVHKVIFNKQKFNSSKKWNFEKENISINDQWMETGHSSIFVDETNFYKLIKINNCIKSNYRLTLGKSKTKDEIIGNKTLPEYGLSVPELKYYGSSLFSKNHNEILIFEKLTEHITAKDMIAKSNRDTGNEILSNIAQNLCLLINNGIYFRDFHFDNVMINPCGELVWIDTSISFIESKEKMKYKVNKKFKSLNQSISHQKWLNGSQWQHFKDNIDLVTV